MLSNPSRFWEIQFRTLQNDPFAWKIFVLPSRRHFTETFNDTAIERTSYLANSSFQLKRPVINNIFPKRLYRLVDNQQAREDYRQEILRIIPSMPEWQLELDDHNHHYLSFASNVSEHNSDGIGEGLISVLFIVDALYDSTQDDIIVIDEPELSLHPEYQKNLCSRLIEYSRDRQIIVSTHSPYFIDFKAIIAGAELCRVSKKSNQSKISRLTVETKTSLQGFLRDRNNPHVLGIDAKEVFFRAEDCVILVEGQEDIYYYNKLQVDLDLAINGNFFGWGVGGAHKMETIARILSDLGFEYVVGILDKDKDDYKVKLKEMFPRYNFFTIPTNDIRTDIPPKKWTSS